MFKILVGKPKWKLPVGRTVWGWTVGPSSMFFKGEAAMTNACIRTFKPFNITFIDRPRISKVEEYLKNLLIFFITPIDILGIFILFFNFDVSPKTAGQMPGLLLLPTPMAWIGFN
jgi:hypothetical protein